MALRPVRLQRRHAQRAARQRWQRQFKDMAPQAGVAFNAMGEAAGSMASTIGDCNGDGYDDIFVTRLVTVHYTWAAQKGL